MKTIVLTTNHGLSAFNTLYAVLEYQGTDAQTLARFRREADLGIGKRADDIAWLAGHYGLDVKFYWTDQQALNFETWHGPLTPGRYAHEAPTYDAQALADILFVGGTAWQFVPGGADTPEALKVRTQVAQIVLGHFDLETPAQEPEPQTCVDCGSTGLDQNGQGVAQAPDGALVCQDCLEDHREAGPCGAGPDHGTAVVTCGVCHTRFQAQCPACQGRLERAQVRVPAGLDAPDLMARLKDLQNQEDRLRKSLGLACGRARFGMDQDGDSIRASALTLRDLAFQLALRVDQIAATKAALAQASPLVLEQDQPSGWWYVRHVQTGGHAGHFQTKAQAQRVLDYLVQTVPVGDWDPARWAGPSSPLASVLDAIKASRSI